MPYGLVRIYPGVNPAEASIIGFSRSIVGIEQSSRILSTLSELGYTACVTNKPEGSISASHLEVKPPLRDDHLKTVCVAIFDAAADVHHHDGMVVLDNRTEVAIPLDGSTLIAERS